MHGTSDISPSWCFTIGRDLTAVTRRFISTQLSTACTVKRQEIIAMFLYSMNFEDQGFEVYELYTPIYPNWHLSKTQIPLHYWSNPRDTTEGLQDVTYSPGEPPHSPLVPSKYFLGNLLLREHPFPANLPSN